MYKALGGNFILALTDLFNKILDKGCYPLNWSTGIITPINKCGSREDPKNYCGIGKIFTSLLHMRIMVWAEDLIPESQFSFRSNRSTTDCIFIIVQNSLCNRKQCFVDFKKAFGNHSLLWTCLADIGVSRKILSFTVNVCNSIYIGKNTATDLFPCQIQEFGKAVS